jgi:hypothetical protein
VSRPVLTLCILIACTAPAFAQSATEPPAAQQHATPVDTPSPWLLVPVFSSSPKLGTAGGGLGAYLKMFDPKSRVSIFGVMYQYTSTHSQIGSVFARTSFGEDHHRIVAIGAFGNIKNDYEDYLGTGQPLKTDANMGAFVSRYLYRATGNWFFGGQGAASNYQVMGATPEDDFILETLGIQGFKSVSVGVTAMHDSRDNEDRPQRGWFLNVNNLAYREGLGGSASFDAYRADFRAFWQHRGRHVLAVRQYNWLTVDAPAAAEATVILRGYKIGQYLSPYTSSLEIEERVSLHRRWGATLFAGAAYLYGEPLVPLDRTTYPMAGAGLHFLIKPEQHMIVNLEYAYGVDGNHGFYIKLGHGW